MKLNSKKINYQKLYEIYSNFNDVDKFLVGYIVAKDEQFVVVEAIDLYGNQDGWCCIRLDNIIQYKTNTKYLKAIEQLFEYSGKARKTLDLKDVNEILISILSSAEKTNKVCIFELCNSQLQDVVGHIKLIDRKTNTVVVENIDNYGQIDGESVVEFSMISSIEFENFDAQRVDILYSINNR